MRSRPTDSSNDSVPAWAKRSIFGRRRARRNRRSARCARPAADGSRPRSAPPAPARCRPACVSTSSISAGELLLGAVEQRQPAVAVAQRAQCRRHALDAGAERGRRRAWAACSSARISVRSCNAPSSCAGLRSQWQPSGSICRASSCGSTRSARVRKPACSGSATAAAISPLSAVSARASSSSVGSAAARLRASETSRPISRWRNPSSARGGEELVMAEPGRDAARRPRPAAAPAARPAARRSSRQPARAPASARRRCRAPAGRAAR